MPTILLADNDPNYVETLVPRLEMDGYRVIVTKTLLETLRTLDEMFLKHKEPDFALIDLHLGNANDPANHDGLKAADKARFYQVPAVLLYVTPFQFYFMPKLSGPEPILARVKQILAKPEKE